MKEGIHTGRKHVKRSSTSLVIRGGQTNCSENPRPLVKNKIKPHNAKRWERLAGEVIRHCNHFGKWSILTEAEHNPRGDNNSAPRCIPKRNMYLGVVRVTYKTLIAIFTIALIWKQPTCPAQVAWSFWYNPTMELYSVTKMWFSQTSCWAAELRYNLYFYDSICITFKRGKRYQWCPASRSSLPCWRGWWLEEAQGDLWGSGSLVTIGWVVDTWRGSGANSSGCVLCVCKNILIPNERKVHFRSVFKHPGYCAVGW